jgi:hypothetical protein
MRGAVETFAHDVDASFGRPEHDLDVRVRGDELGQAWDERYMAKELGPRGMSVNTIAFNGGAVRDDKGLNATLLAPGSHWITGQRRAACFSDGDAPRRAVCNLRTYAKEQTHERQARGSAQ